MDTSERRIEPDDDNLERSSDPLLIAVDDDVATLELLCEIAADAGWTARGFTRLEAFRASLQRERPALMIIDDDLPDGRGGDMARELREDPRTTDVPLLVCTGAHPMRRAEIGGWAPVIAKPFDVADIEAVLKQAARRDGGAHNGRRYGQAG